MNKRTWKYAVGTVVGITALVLLSSPSKAVEAFGWTFTAPNVSAPSGGGAANLPTIINSPSGGDIVYDYTSNQFFGYGTNGTPAWQALGAGTGAFVPTGTILPFAGSSAPTGYLLCDGSAYSTTTYAALYGVIGYAYGGSGANFDVPNAKGVFLRGAGSQTIGGISYSGTQGTTQGDQIQGHQHAYNEVTSLQVGGTGSVTYTISGQPSANTSGYVNDGYGPPRVGSETRPANISVTYIIKY